MSSNLIEIVYDLIKGANVFSYVGFEGKSEKLSCVYSVVILSFFNILIFSKSFILNPISCYVPSVPKENSKGFMKVFDIFCWINGTNLFQHNQGFPSNEVNWAAYSQTNKLGKLKQLNI